MDILKPKIGRGMEKNCRTTLNASIKAVNTTKEVVAKNFFGQ